MTDVVILLAPAPWDTLARGALLALAAFLHSAAAWLTQIAPGSESLA